MKKDSSNLIQYESLFEAQDRKNSCTRSSLLFYYIGMPIHLLINQCTLLDIVNSARTIVYGVIPNPNCKNIFFTIIKTNEK